MSIFEELKRRNVFRVAIAYALLGWAVLQGADFLLDLAGAPDWVIRVFAIAGLVGFPFALFFAWAFELTPEGIKREHEVDRSQSIAPRTGRKLNGIIIGLLVLVIALMAVERVFFAGKGDPEPEPVAAGVSKSIAVLPFTDLSQAQDQGWFADGLAEEILNALVRVPDLQVAARTSSFAFKGSNKEIPAIAAELGVAHVLEGSVRSAGNRIRVTAQLIRAADGFHLWSQNYDRDVADMIGIQEDLATSIATALETTMDPEALAQMAQVGTESVEAYQEYLRGLERYSNSWLSQTETSGLTEAYRHFERARALDPTFAEAHVQAANYWKVELSPSRIDTGTSGLDAKQSLGEYNQRIGMAIENARTEPDRLRSLADRAMVDLRLREARRLFEQYLELRPNDHLARFEYLGVLAMLSEREAGREVVAYFKAKGKADGESANIYVNEAYRFVDPSEASDFALQAVDRWPNSDAILYQAHRTLLWAGRNREAAELAARYGSLVPGSNPLVRARQACAEGDRATAEAILDGLDQTGRNSLSREWLLQNMLGNTKQEIEILRPLEESGVPFQLANFLSYPNFDARPYPSLMAVLDREGVQRLPPVAPPFQCPPPVQPSVAVLPFVNMSAEAAQEYFSDGITEEVINALVRVPGVKVAARTSVFAFKGQELDVRAIGSDLGVTHVLEGSVRSDGDQLRITAQLIQVKDGFHLWSETFDRQRVNVFAIQEEIAAAIAGVLNERLGAQEAAPEVARISVKAYDDYLRARADLRSRGEAELRRARQLFESVTETHPDYAPAWAALAITADVMDDDDQAENYALRALELDPDNVDALTALGAVYRDTWRWAQAAATFERALAIDPDSAELLEDYGEFLARTGRFDRLLEITTHGYTVDPYLGPLVEVYAVALLASGERAKAIDVVEQTIARGGADWLNSVLVTDLVGRGDGPGLRALIARLPIAPETRSVYLDALDHPEDPAALAALESMLEPRPFTVEYAFPEMILLHLGHADTMAVKCSASPASYACSIDDQWFLPAYASLRAQPAFADLLEAFGLPAWWDRSGWPDMCRREAETIVCQ